MGVNIALTPLLFYSILNPQFLIYFGDVANSEFRIPNFEPTLRSESREYLHSMPSREEETRVYLS